MEAELSTLIDQIAALFGSYELAAQRLLLPSRQAQYAIIIGMAVLAWVLRRAFGHRLYEWMRSLEGRPKWQLRYLLVLHKRLYLILFTTLMWLSTGMMRVYTNFPAKSFLLELVATIATAWLLVSPDG